jgi:hypothetical protein
MPRIGKAAERDGGESVAPLVGGLEGADAPPVPRLQASH